MLAKNTFLLVGLLGITSACQEHQERRKAPDRRGGVSSDSSAANLIAKPAQVTSAQSVEDQEATAISAESLIDPSKADDDDKSPEAQAEDSISFATFNIWGSEVTTTANKATAIENASRADVVCLQEVEGRGKNLSHFTSYPHRVVATNESINTIEKVGQKIEGALEKVGEAAGDLIDTLNPFGLVDIPGTSRDLSSVAILSKHPIVKQKTTVIQRDPVYSQWTRHAVYAQVSVKGTIVDVFCYHNTYNFGRDNHKYEKMGMHKMRSWVDSIAAWESARPVVVMGDFNIADSETSQHLQKTFPSKAIANASAIDQVRGNNNVLLKGYERLQILHNNQPVSDHGWLIEAKMTMVKQD